ncbi:MAG: hypothetical protein AB7E72_14630 [Lysobacterales bacterium]
MDVFTMVVALVGIGAIAKIANRRHKRETEARQRYAGEDMALRQEVAALRERVVTLEQIVTDPAYDLKRQIQALETRRAA